MYKNKNKLIHRYQTKLKFSFCALKFIIHTIVNSVDKI